MSSLFAINKMTKSNKGAGLPFYRRLDYLFTNVNKGFNDDAGLWRTPADKPPMFQLWVNELETTVQSIIYKQLNTAFTFSPPSLLSNVSTLLRASSDGTLYCVHHTTDVSLGFYCPAGRWYIEFTTFDGSDIHKYYSEEFVVTDCCP